MLFPKNLYEEITTSQKHPLRWLLASLLWCAVPGIFLLLFQLLKGNKAFMNLLVSQVTTPLKHLLSRFCALFPFALAEVVWALGVLLVFLFLIRTVWLLIAREGKLKRLVRRFLGAVSAALIIYCGFTFLWGINYYADSFVEQSWLIPRGCTTEELGQLTASFTSKCNELSGELPRDEAGVTQLELAPLFQEAGQHYQNIFQEFPFLEQPVFDPKPMFFSRVISCTGFTGFYFPMTAESLVNVDQPDCLIPSTILHELSHQCNIAGEDESNFLAILAGLHCEDPTYQYSSALLGYIYLSNALYSADRSLWQEVCGNLNDEVRTDLSANSAYWKQFESPLQDTSEKIYTGFLESYGQTDGMRSYGKCVDLLAAYYFDNPEASQ